MPPRRKTDRRAGELLAAAYGHADCELLIGTLTEAAGAIAMPDQDRKRLLQIASDLTHANEYRHHILRNHLTTTTPRGLSREPVDS